MPYTPYNPYARPPQKRAIVRPSATPWGLIACASALLIVGTLLVSSMLIQKIAEKQVAKILNKNFDAFRTQADIHFKSVKLSFLRRTINISGITATVKGIDEPVTVKKISLWGVDSSTLRELVVTRKPVIPRTLQARILGLHVPAQLAGQKGSDILASLGYDGVELSTYVSLSLSPEKKSIRADDIEVDVKDAGRVSLSFALGNVKWPSKSEMALLKKNPKAFAERAQDFTAMTIQNFAVRYDDESFVQRAIDAFVAMGEEHPVSLVNLALETPPAVRGVASVAHNGFVHDSLLKVRQFLLKPGFISLEANPRIGVPLVGLIDERTGGSVEELAKKLSLSVETNETTSLN